MPTRRFEQRNDDGSVTLCDIDLETGMVARSDAPLREIGSVETSSALEFRTERYQVEELIGSGGFADVVRAHDRRLNRIVALKIPRRDGAELRAEGMLAARLQHPNIVPIYDAGDGADGAPYVAMKLLEGSSLREVLRGIAQGDARTPGGPGPTRPAQTCAASRWAAPTLRRSAASSSTARRSA